MVSSKVWIMIWVMGSLFSIDWVAPCESSRATYGLWFYFKKLVANANHLQLEVYHISVACQEEVVNVFLLNLPFCVIKLPGTFGLFRYT